VLSVHFSSSLHEKYITLSYKLPKDRIHDKKLCPGSPNLENTKTNFFVNKDLIFKFWAFLDKISLLDVKFLVSRHEGTIENHLTRQCWLLETI